MSCLDEFTAHQLILHELLQPGSQLTVTFMYVCSNYTVLKTFTAAAPDSCGSFLALAASTLSERQKG